MQQSPSEGKEIVYDYKCAYSYAIGYCALRQECSYGASRIVDFIAALRHFRYRQIDCRALVVGSVGEVGESDDYQVGGPAYQCYAHKQACTLVMDKSRYGARFGFLFSCGLARRVALARCGL